MRYGENQQDYDEWVAARNLIDKFDGEMTELRKTGFAFITGILAISGIFLPSNADGIPYGAKAAIIIATMVLIVAVALFEKNIAIKQKAASQRAIVLERRLNLELTEIIYYQYLFNKGSLYQILIYVLFISGACILAWSLPIDPNPITNLLIVGLMFTIFVAIIAIIHLQFKFRRPENREGQDWTIDKIECQPGDLLGITLTNFSGDEIKVPDQNRFIYQIEDETGHIIFQNKKPITIQSEQSYTWYWDTKDVDEGIYHIIPDKGDPIGRNVRIIKKAP